jgi:hypothetical protein
VVWLSKLTRRKAMADLSVGFNGDVGLLKWLEGFVVGVPNPVKSLYCSVPGLLPSARADDRLARNNVPCGSLQMSDLSLILESGFDVHYCLNATYYDGEQIAVITGVVKRLIQLGVTWFIVAYPPVAGIVNSFGGNVIWSTIQGVADPRTLQHVVDNYAEVVCPSIYKNRHLGWIQRVVNLVGGNAIELLANEFCMLDRSPCSGVHRRACYEHHTRGVSKWNPYPMSICRAARRADPASWLRAPFILPEWLSLYPEDVTFKITGRTHPSDLVRRTVEMYAAGESYGNLCDLWPLGSIVGGRDPVPEIPIKDIPVELLTKTPTPCGDTAVCSMCKHCDEVFKAIMKGR